MLDLSSFVRNCEKQIGSSEKGISFVAPEQRDRWRVFAVAKLYDIASNGREIEEMLLVAPGLYEGLLRAYHSLLTQRANALWWQRLEDSKEPAWPNSIRDAITEVAEYLGVDPRSLADELDEPAYPRTRQIITLIAQRNAPNDDSHSAQRPAFRLPRNGYADLGDIPGPDDGRAAVHDGTG